MAVMSSFDLWLPFLILAGLLALWLGGFKARTFVICALLIVAVGDGLISNFLKKTVNRPRPSQSEAVVRVVTLRIARTCRNLNCKYPDLPDLPGPKSICSL